MSTRFVYRPHWFVLAQTEGAVIPPASVPAWDARRALAALAVMEIPFDATNGNVLGFARERSIAINPVNPMPHKTRFHELAHVLLGHTSEGLQADGEITPRNLRECEAEGVAFLCCAALDRRRAGRPTLEHQCTGFAARLGRDRSRLAAHRQAFG